MERYFDEELKSLREKILYMGSIIEIMVKSALNGFKELKIELLQQVLVQENEINHLHIEIDDLCLKLLALRQPMAFDLRFITAVMKINSELERIGDQAVNISQNSMELLKQPGKNVFININSMMDMVENMVKESLVALTESNTSLAQKVLLKDDDVDNLKAEIFKELLEKIKTGKSVDVNTNFELILISRNLEKIADHTTNICEDVIFMVLGKDIRHHHVDIDNNKT